MPARCEVVFRALANGSRMSCESGVNSSTQIVRKALQISPNNRNSTEQRECKSLIPDNCTSERLFRRQTLYPTELRARRLFSITYKRPLPHHPITVGTFVGTLFHFPALANPSADVPALPLPRASATPLDGRSGWSS